VAEKNESRQKLYSVADFGLPGVLSKDRIWDINGSGFAVLA
jgi:hypothetical protein